MLSRFRSLAYPIWLYTILNPLPSSLISLLDGLYQVYHSMYHLSSSLMYGDPCLLSCTYILGHILRMQAFTFLFCVLALCMIYVYMRLNSVRMRCKTHVLHHSISDYHISILLKIQYILPHLITFQQIPNLVGFIYGYQN